MAKVVIEFEIAGGEKVRTSNEKIIKQLNELGVAYTEVGNDAEKSAQDQVNATKQVEKSYKDVLKEYRANKQELQALAIAGQENTDRFKELTKQLGQQADALEESRFGINAAKSGFDATVGSLNGLVGGFSAVTGALAVFGVESEATEKAILKVQGALALTQGLDNLIKSQKSFKTLALQIKGPVQAAFTGLKGAIIATGIGALVVGLGLLIANFDKVKAVVLNLIPGLANVGKFISNIVNSITDFVGLTSESARAADDLAKQNEKITASQEYALKIAKASGVAQKDLDRIERETAENQLKRLQEQIRVRGKATEDEAKLEAELQEKIAILRAGTTKINKDEATKRLEEIKKALEKEQAAELANQQRRIELISDEGEQALAALEFNYQQELKDAKEKGEDLNLVEQVYQKKRLEQIEKNEEDARKKRAEEAEKTKSELEKKIEEINNVANSIYLTLEKELQQNILKVLNDETLNYAQKDEQILELKKQFDKERIQEELLTIEQLIAIGSLDVNAYEELTAKKALLSTQLKELELQNEKEVNDKRRENYLTIIEETTNLLNSLANIYSEYYNNRVNNINEFYDKELQLLEASRDKELNRFGLTSQAKEKIESDFADKSTKIENQRNKELKKLQKEKADVDFAVQLAQIASNIALGIAQINANAAVNADITQTLRAILTAIILSNGAAQIYAATNARNQVKSLGMGGILDGPSHSQGGIPVGNSGIFVEGEEAVINKRSTKMFAPLLSAINVAGGGVPLMTDVSKFMANGGQLGYNNSNAASVTTTQQDLTSIKAYLVQSEVNSGLVRDSRIRRQSRF